MQVKFKMWDCDVRFHTYSNGRPAIVLIDAEDGSPIATASVNVPEEKLAIDEIAIKDYSENEGMLEVMVYAGIVSEPVRKIKSGFVTIPICKLLRTW